MLINAIAGTNTNILFPSVQGSQRSGASTQQPAVSTFSVNALDHRQVARNYQGDTFVSRQKPNAAKVATPKATEQISKPVLDAPASAFASFGSMLGNIFALNN